MRSKVADILEGLAAALRSEEEEWEVVSQGSGEKSEVKSEVKTYTAGGAGSVEPVVKSSVGTSSALLQGPVQPAPAGPSASHIAYHPDVRCYVVIANPADSSALGFWSGPNPQTWRLLESKLKGKRLLGSGARLRRVQSLEEAKQIWATAHPSRTMPIAHQG